MHKKFNKIFLVILFLFTILTLYGCDLFSNEDKLTAISIEGDRVVLIDDMLIFSINPTPSNKSRLVNWASSDPTIAWIDVAGVLHAYKQGQVTITATSKEDSNIKDVIIVDVVGASPISITINGDNSINVGSYKLFSATVNPINSSQLVTWKSSDTSIVTVDEHGSVKGIGVGSAIITAVSVQNTNISKAFNVSITEASISSISISGPSTVTINQSVVLIATLLPGSNEETFGWTSSDTNIASVDNFGNVTGVSVGEVSITCMLNSNNAIKNSFVMSVTEELATEIIISGRSYVEVGRSFKLSSTFNDTGGGTIKWESLNNSIVKIYEGNIVGVSVGNTQIKASLIENPNVSKVFPIEVISYQITTTPIDATNESFVNNIINQMTLEEKIGQLFIVGVSDYGGDLTSDCSETIEQYKFGNFIYMGGNVKSTHQVVNLSRNLQYLVDSTVGIPAFISIDQEGGMVQRMEVGATHFLGSMALAATNNSENAYLLGAAAGVELNNYGINVDFAPVLDVNNNPNNPIINVRSYSDDAAKVAVFGKRMFEGLASSNVMGCAKHFPGHGDTSVDSHTSLPIIYHDLIRLNEIELLPFKNAITSGIDAIMTTHIIFSEIDDINPATLSHSVLTGILRNQLGFEGLIITDGLGMGAIANNYSSYSEVGALAIKAGVDILTFTTYKGDPADPYYVIDAYEGILNAVNNNEIPESRIDESVRRILLKKIKYGLFENSVPDISNADKTFANHIALNELLAKKSLTKVKGGFTSLDPNKSTLIISPQSPRYAIDSFAKNISRKLTDSGFTNCTDDYIKDAMKAKDITALINKARGYDQVVIATYNANSAIGNLVTSLYNDNEDLVVFSMRNPYDIFEYPTVKNYYCAYDYTQVVIDAIGNYLKGDFVATGILPINLSN